MLVKVCGLKNIDNVTALLSKVSPDLLGMIFYEKSKRYVGSLSFAIDSEIPRVGVFVNASLDHIISMQQTIGFEWVQLHGNEDTDFIASLKDTIAVKVIKVFRVTDSIDLNRMRPFEPLVDYFLFDTQTSQYGGSGRQFDWKILESYDLSTPFILSGGIDVEHVKEICSIYATNPKMAGVDINSKFETEPGIKDPEKVAGFINTIREITNNQVSYDRNR